MEKTKTILIFAYYSFKDPIFQSAVLPYFQNLSKEGDLKFILLTFEKDEYRLSKDEYAGIETDLKNNHNILWYRSEWRSGSFKILKKIYDFISSIIFALKLIKKHQVDIIYSEAFPGAIMGYHLAKITKTPHMVHSFEPHTDYMVDSGVWKNNSWEALLLRRYEKKIARNCSDIMTATKKMEEKLRGWGAKGKIHRVPSCVDINFFNYFEKSRNEIREQYKIQPNDCLIVYLGKFGGMYMEDEAIEFFKACLENKTSNFKVLILSHDNPNRIKKIFRKHGISDDRWIFKRSLREEVPHYLSAADFGFVAVRQKPSKRYCSPIKDGEYWACGLPIIIPKGISDDYILAEENDIGIVMEGVSSKSFKTVIKKMNMYLKDNKLMELREKCRKFAIKDRSVDTYKEFYRNIFLSK